MADNFLVRVFKNSLALFNDRLPIDESRLPKLESYDRMKDMFKAQYFPNDAEHVQVTTHDVVQPYIVPNFGARAKNIDSDDYRSQGALIGELVKGVKTKSDLAEKLEKIREYDYTESVLRDLSNDVLTKNYDRNEKEFFIFKTLNSSNKNLADLDVKINNDLKKLKIYDTLHDIIEDLLFSGQYILNMDYNNQELDDTLTQTDVLPAYCRSKMVKIFIQTESKLKDPANYLVFSLFSNHKKVKVKSASGAFYYLKLPKGIFSETIIPKMTSLKLLEALQPLIELQSVDEKMYFRVRFPPGKDATEAYKECRDYEKLLKSMLTLDKANSVDDIIDQISRVKVLPMFGSQDEMQSQTITKINRIDLDQLKDLRMSISSALKVNLDGNNETNPEYFKLIKRIRGFLRISVQEFMVGYIKKKYDVEVDSTDFTIEVPEVQGAEDLDTIDYVNMHQSTYKDILDLISTTQETIARTVSSPYIDKKTLINSYSDKLFKLTGSRVMLQYNKLDPAVKKALEEPVQSQSVNPDGVDPDSDQNDDQNSGNGDDGNGGFIPAGGGPI